MTPQYRWIVFVSFYVFTAFGVGACAPDGGQTGSETNWLKRCTTSEECGEGSCLCGICTWECDAENACTQTNGPALCVSTGQSAYQSVCGGSTTPPNSVCVPTC